MIDPTSTLGQLLTLALAIGITWLIARICQRIWRSWSKFNRREIG
jgi:hypothetical protein